MSHKKSLFAMAVVALASAGASAQTSVSLYGIIDAAMRSESAVTRGANGQQVKQLAPGGMSQSRLGVNVSEDLGDGWRALANLEHRLMSDNGAASSASDFWRQAWVGLITPVGRITVGRQYNVLFDLTTSTFAAYRYSPYVEQFKPELGVSVGNRQSNMVKYAITAGGFTGELQVSAGEGVGDKTTGGMARYQLGSFAFGAGMLNAKAPSGAQIKGTVYGGSYSSGPLYVNLGYGKNKFDAANPADVAYRTLIVAYSTALVSPATPANQILTEAAFDVKDRELLSTGFTYQLTPQFNIGAQFYKMDQNHHNAVFAGRESSATMWSTVADYALSKRTDVYVEYDRISIKSNSPTAFAAGCAAPAFNGANPATSTLLNTSGCKRSRTGYMVGVRHRF
ncbi:MAG: porin [Inhella sp.]